MAEYIEREALKKNIGEKANPEKCTHIIPQDVYSTVLTIVECEPTADVAEVKHGKWIEHFEVGYSGAKYYRYNCSVCGCLALSKDNENYCHNCGAKMDLGDNEA